MMGEGVLLALGVAVMAWLVYRTRHQERLLQAGETELEQLKCKHAALKHALKAHDRRLDVLLSSISEAVLRVDDQGQVLGGNGQAQKLFHFSSETVFPQSILVFYRDTEWLESFKKAVAALPAQKDLPEMKVNGRVLLPRLAALGEHEALLLCLDVTAYSQLQQKQKSLLENLMHDLKTPLTSLLGYARSIEAFGDDIALRQEAVQVIVREAKHINGLMNHMLT